MKKLIDNPYIILICRILVGYVFLSFGISKIADPAFFAKEIGNYGIAPEWSLNLIALILPWIEIFAGLMLIMGINIKANSLLIASLLVFFIVMIASAWARGLDISCGCSAHNPMKVGLPKILENSACTILCVLMWMFPNKGLTISNLLPKTDEN
ncbi:MAG: DoxX family protein [Bacteroidetes bacterium 4572_77]|nr:MAG: DoxX family protein [Bacteroidetes bacterium 4572_77]